MTGYVSGLINSGWEITSWFLAALSIVLLYFLIGMLIKLKKIRSRLKLFSQKKKDSILRTNGSEKIWKWNRNLWKPGSEYTFFFEESQTYNVVIGKDNRICDLNRAFLNIFENEKEELIGKNLLKLVAPEKREECKSYLSSHHEGKATSNQELEFSGKAGPRRILFGERHLIIKQNNLPVGIMISGIDITSLRRIELQEDELKKKIALLARMETLGIMAGGIAHDLKNLFNPVLAYPDLILQELPPDSPLSIQVKRIKSAASRASELILNFLSLALRGQLDLQPIDVNQVIKNYCASMEFKSMESRFPSVKIIIDLSEALPPVMGLVSHLQSVVMNLVRNGCEAMEEGGELRISSYILNLESAHKGRQQIPSGDYVVVQISDAGKGIKPEEISSIFKPLPSGKNMVRTGSGIGLVVVLGIIDDLGGYIDLKSEPGQGTDVFIYMPCIPEVEARPA